MTEDQLERHWLRGVVGWVLAAIAVGLLAAAVLFASKVGAQEVEKVEIRCHGGVCVVPERQLMLILKSRLCGVAT